MRFVSYFTDATHTMTQRPIYPVEPMSGAKEIRIASEPLSRPFEGFGIALTGASLYLLAQMDEDEREAFLRSVFTSDGLDLDVARLTIGSSDYSAEVYSYDDVPGDTSLAHFSISRDEKYIIPMIREILSIKPTLRIFASPWSPPGWMKTSGNMCGGYMREEYIDCYAEYIVKYLQAYEQRGIHITAVTVQNEPENSQYGRMPACIWHPDTEARFVISLREKLTLHGMSTGIWLLDHAFNEWRRPLGQLNDHDRLRSAASGVAFHYYGGAVEDTEPLRDAYPELEYHFTEAGPRLYDNYATDRCKWVNLISKCLACGFSTFTGWNLLLDETGGPNIGPFMCGGLVTRSSADGSLSFSGQYRAFMHTSHFISPGSRIYPLTVAECNVGMASYPKIKEPVVGIAARCPDGKLVISLANHNTDKRQLRFSCDGVWYYVEMLPDSVCTVVER